MLFTWDKIIVLVGLSASISPSLFAFDWIQDVLFPLAVVLN